MTDKELDTYYIKVAKLCSENSKAERLKVGAILVKDQQIISDGFNGTPRGFNNNCEYLILNEEVITDDEEIQKYKGNLNQEHYELKTKPYVLHAEANCLMKSLRQGNSTIGSTIYVTHAPCIECSKLIIQSGIDRVVYLNKYKNEDGLSILRQANIAVQQFKLEENEKN